MRGQISRSTQYGKRKKRLDFRKQRKGDFMPVMEALKFIRRLQRTAIVLIKSRNGNQDDLMHIDATIKRILLGI